MSRPTLRTVTAKSGQALLGDASDLVGQTIELDPDLIGFGQNVRRNEIPDNESVVDLANSIKRRQLQDIEVRVNPKPTDEHPQRFILNFGFRRLAAAQMIRNGDKKLGIKADEDFRIRVTVASGEPAKAGKQSPELQAFINAWTENNEREEMTPIDAAHAYSVLRTQYKLDDGASARILGVSKPWLVTLRALEKTDLAIQELVISGDIPAKEAAKTVGLKPDAIARVVTAVEKANAAMSSVAKAGAEPAAPATKGSNKAAVKAGKAAIAAETAADPQAKDARGRKAGQRFRDVREVRALFAGIVTNTGIAQSVRDYAQIMVEYVSNGSSDAKVIRALANLANGKTVTAKQPASQAA